MAFFGLFVLQNVFDQEVYRPAAASAIIQEAVLPGEKPVPVCDETKEIPARPGGAPEDRRPEGSDHE